MLHPAVPIIALMVGQRIDLALDAGAAPSLRRGMLVPLDPFGSDQARSADLNVPAPWWPQSPLSKSAIDPT